MKGTKFFVVFLSLAIAYIGCKSSKDKNVPQQSINKLGAVIPLTGSVATYGKSLQRGIDIAVEDEKGSFSMIYEDSKASPTDGINAINKLINADQVKFVIGDATSGVTLQIAPIAERNKVILMVPIATSDDIKNSGDYIFRNAPRNEKQASKATVFITSELKATRIGVLYKQNEYGVNLAQKFKAELASKNILPVAEDSYQEGTTDFRNIISKMKQAQSDAIFFPGNYEETALILKQALELGLKAPFIGTDGAYSEKLIELAGKAAESSYYTMLGVSETSNMYKYLLEKYRAKYNSDPDIFSCYGYESAKILIDAIKKTGYNPDAVKNYLYNNAFDSLTGELRFDSDGEVIRDYGILMVKNGLFTDFAKE